MTETESPAAAGFSPALRWLVYEQPDERFPYLLFIVAGCHRPLMGRRQIGVEGRICDVD
jgi:hypothetical protein